MSYLKCLLSLSGFFKWVYAFPSSLLFLCLSLFGPRFCLFYSSHALGGILCMSSSKLRYARCSPCNYMQQLAFINRGGKHYFSCGFARSVQSSTFPKHVGRKQEPEVISAVGSALPLFQSFPVFLAAAVPSHCAISALITASLTKPLHLPRGPGWSEDRPPKTAGGTLNLSSWKLPPPCQKAPIVPPRSAFKI